MPSTSEHPEPLNEYVLNQTGCSYHGNPSHRSHRAWNYGQFDDGMLDAALDILTRNLKPVQYKTLADPVQAVRHVALVIKSGLVLKGKWNDDQYRGDTDPTRWLGSVEILKKYMKLCRPVKYGQCWVFAGVTVTVFRALGLPCRAVTNFISGVDTEGNNTIDKFYDAKGFDVTKNYTKDFDWNFHVWTEVWLARPDLDTPKMDGWQALDTTGYPPNPDDNDVFCVDLKCGPAPVLALKHGYCNLNYDAGFLFSFANADEVHWLVGADGKPSLLRINGRKIGQHICTRRPDSNEELDLGGKYKFKEEGGPEERTAVLLAHKMARNRKLRWAGVYDESTYGKDFKLKLQPNYGAMIGDDLTISLEATNIGQDDKLINVIITVYPKTYNGVLGKAFYREEKNIKLNGGSDIGADFKFTLTEADYFPHLQKRPHLKIDVYADVTSKTGERGQPKPVIKSRNFDFAMPILSIKGTTAAKVGNDVEYEIAFTNPLSTTLSMCALKGESPGFRYVKLNKDIKDIQPKQPVTYTMNFVAKRPGKHDVLFKLYTKELDAHASTTIKIVE